MKYTLNYSLRKPDSTDIVDINDFNTNVDKIDNEIKKVNDSIENCTINLNSELVSMEDKIIENYATKNDLEIERNRINLLSKIENGETNGNSELLDIRNGADGVVYPTAAEAVRKQIKRLTNIIFPDDYPDLSTIITRPEQAGEDKIVTATFNSIYIKQTKATSGKGGLSFEVDYRKYKILTFNIEYKGMGCNCGVYYYSDNQLLSPYKAIASQCDDEIRRTSLKIEFDIATIENTMKTLGANKLKFIVWNNDNPIVEGYNRITDFSFDDYVLPINQAYNINQKLENISYNKVKTPKKLIGDTSNLKHWGGNLNYTYKNGVIHYKYTSSSGNNGLMTDEFIPKNTLISFSINITEIISGGLVLYVKGVKKSDKSTVYLAINKIQSLGIHKELIDLDKFKDLDLSKEINILVANLEVTDIKFKDFLVYENDYLEYELIQDNLSDTLKAIDKRIKDIPYNNVKISNTINHTNNGLTNWGSNLNYTNNNGVIHYKYTSSSGNNGLMTYGFIPKNTFVAFSINITEIISGGLVLYVKGVKKSDKSTVYLSINKIQSLGIHKELIDLNNLVVYKDLDLSKEINILVANLEVTDIKFKDFLVYENDYLEYELIQDNLSDTLKAIDSQINVIKSEVGTSSQNNYLTSPNGTKFILNVSDNGSLSTIPYIPNKTLFIGNSLLIGNKGFGMCATTSKKDYYYHVTQYIKSLNDNATFEKISGTEFEGATNIETVNTWLENNINNKNNDYNLIYVQLGDNVNTTDKVNNFKTSCEYFLKHLRNKFKNARIVWVGMWYSSSEKVDTITAACNNTGCQFINIVDLNTNQNRGKIGDTIYYDDGSTSVVSSNGVASHPGDAGNFAIANRIIEKSLVI